jgi:D-xylose reductase
MSSQPSIFAKLNRTGDKIPLVGFGTARISTEEAEQIVYNAIKVGYRLIDAALLYRNEPEVGKGVRRAISEGIVKRKDLFSKAKKKKKWINTMRTFIYLFFGYIVVGKLWNHFHGKHHVRPAFDVTLENFGLDYIDLYLVHFPISTAYEDPRSNFAIANSNNKLVLEPSPLHETWKELEKLVDQGLVRNIGVSNFNVQAILDLLTYARIRPSVLEIEYHPYLQQKRLVNWATAQDLHIIAYASFGNTAVSHIPASVSHVENLLTHPVIKKIADKNSLNPGQVLLEFATQQNITVIPKTVQIERMKCNLDLFSRRLSDQDMDAIKALDINARFYDFVPETYGFELPIFD